jgi:hypothetical protein
MNKTIDQITEGGLGDCRLCELRWSQDGQDVYLAFHTPAGKPLTVKATWATEVQIDVDFGTYSGMPLVFDSDVVVLDDGSIRLRVDFGAAPEGFISLRCNQLDIE